MLSHVQEAKHSVADVETLSSRVVMSDIECPTEALHVFVTNALIDEFNDRKLKCLPQPHYTISATDSKHDTLTGQLTVSLGHPCKF